MEPLTKSFSKMKIEEEESKFHSKFYALVPQEMKFFLEEVEKERDHNSNHPFGDCLLELFRLANNIPKSRADLISHLISLKRKKYVKIRSSYKIDFDLINNNVNNKNNNNNKEVKKGKIRIPCGYVICEIFQHINKKQVKKMEEGLKRISNLLSTVAAQYPPIHISLNREDLHSILGQFVAKLTINKRYVERVSVSPYIFTGNKVFFFSQKQEENKLRKSFRGRAMPAFDLSILHSASRELRERTGFAFGDEDYPLLSSSSVQLFDLNSGSNDVTNERRKEEDSKRVKEERSAQSAGSFSILSEYTEHECAYDFLGVFIPYQLLDKNFLLDNNNEIPSAYSFPQFNLEKVIPIAFDQQIDWKEQQLTGKLNEVNDLEFVLFYEKVNGNWQMTKAAKESLWGGPTLLFLLSHVDHIFLPSGSDNNNNNNNISATFVTCVNENDELNEDNEGDKQNEDNEGNESKVNQVKAISHNKENAINSSRQNRKEC